MTTDKATVTGIKKNKETPKKAEREKTLCFFISPNSSKKSGTIFAKNKREKNKTLTKELK